jgi:Zn-dependent peptidase ImmA (M78 family)
MIDNDEEYDLDDEIINKIPDENDKKFIIDFIQKDGVKYLKEIGDKYNITLYATAVGDGNICYNDESNCFEIYLNEQKAGTRRQRFTLAHEFGHFFLHQDAIKQYKSLDRGDLCDVTDKKERSNKVKMEKEANNFAAAILMPSRQFIKYFYEQKGLINRVADYFLVSIDAAQIRAAKLGLTIFER